jgi:hypothetical protein
LERRASFELAEHLEWASYDPYDLLLSPRLRGLPSRSPLAARVAVQIGRRSGAGVRRALGVPRHAEAKTLADYLQAATLLARASYAWARGYTDGLAGSLIGAAVGQPAGLAWGLEFPYASRFTTAPPRTPNIFVTTSAACALLDVHAVTANANVLEAAAAGCRFLVDGLGSFERGGLRWLRYWPEQDDTVVNVQASAASLLARAGAALADPELSEVADEAAATVVACQRSDGSWPYSCDPRASFVDGFHTGFVLQGLAEYLDARDGIGVVVPGMCQAGAREVPGTAVEARDALARGLLYFRERLLTPAGLPRARPGGPASDDGQTVAQCVQTLAVCSPRRSDLELARRLWERGLDERTVWTPRSSRYTALRWTLGPGTLAGAHLLAALSKRDEP